ncbi:MAG: hypothetical protein COW01_00525 [Bdellovibrionales bacterium CG12_big_fil_rev_8_21_14_0_65_38_15]|nr:MAG: hypothetical protein COW79_10060 [Bdellovibrionales bacterium CG22_combo_CG10-13_8_21_14_all_38_13]PIQ57451.1 MAG: hypothetical protein COW01_00525 [Bdellovibrionales bacterium CG12_big_fil_rev_8_21_14_0_65_38_15]PIR31172.1 MAG: hypothetical protein COV38_02005 [Bdellovibrionales bacterium CG11_big_fil_rev_8_21_14_0_20_38_13]
MVQESKEDIHYKILGSVTKLEVNKGHLLWTISQVATDSGVSRTLIYYYYGKEKEKLLSEAMKYMVQTVFNLEGLDPIMPRERIKLVLQQLNQMPYLLVLFYLNRRADNEIGQIIKDAEESLFSLLKKLSPGLTKESFMMIYLLELGCALHGDVDHEMIDTLFEKLN